MDSYTEELVVRENSHKEISRLVLYLVLLFSLPIIFFLMMEINSYFFIVAICAALGAIVASYYLVTGLYVEYEYTVTNSNITIDRVSAKRSRKQIISVDIKRFNTLKKLGNSDFETKKYRKVFTASKTHNGDDVYGAEMHLDKFGGDCLLLFSPGEKTMEAMKPFLRNNIKIELFKSGKDKVNKKDSSDKK